VQGKPEGEVLLPNGASNGACAVRKVATGIVAFVLAGDIACGDVIVLAQLRKYWYNAAHEK
jgi:hypothetical protein